MTHKPIYLDLKTCSKNRDGLLETLNEVFGKAVNDSKIAQTAHPLPLRNF